MNIVQFQRLRSFSPTDELQALPQPREAGAGGFGTVFKDAIGRVDATQKVADEQINAFVAGEQENLHEVMISMNQAKLSFQLMTEVRNKTLETYQELMRMQI